MRWEGKLGKEKEEEMEKRKRKKEKEKKKKLEGIEWNAGQDDINTSRTEHQRPTTNGTTTVTTFLLH